MNYCIDLILSKAFCIFIFFHFLDSRLSVLKGFHFYFCFLMWMKTENITDGGKDAAFVNIWANWNIWDKEKTLYNNKRHRTKFERSCSLKATKQTTAQRSHWIVSKQRLIHGHVSLWITLFLNQEQIIIVSFVLSWKKYFVSCTLVTKNCVCSENLCVRWGEKEYLSSPLPWLPSKLGRPCALFSFFP